MIWQSIFNYKDIDNDFYKRKLEMKRYLFIILFSSLLHILFAADSKTITNQQSLNKKSYEDRKSGILNGNNTTFIFYNYGGIGNWNIAGRQNSGIYPTGSEKSYIAEMTPIIAAEVTDVDGNTIHIVSDGIVVDSRSMMDHDEDGRQLGFDPVTGYDNPGNSSIALSNQPDTWPNHWPETDASRDGFWNGEFCKYPRADQESYFVMNDYSNDEFEFYPDSADSSKRGLGITAVVRGYQSRFSFVNDVLIFKYVYKNTGTTDYDDFICGFYGDLDVGDEGNQQDDDAWFDPDNEIFFQWDHDFWSDANGGFVPDYVAIKILETPGNPYDKIDNDHDGMTDESQFDGIDNDADWNSELNDIGSDGIGPLDSYYTSPDVDGTEGNGIPDVGEPNFEFRDKDESDQIGISSCVAQPWPGILLSNDDDIWVQLQAGYFPEIQQTVDLTFLMGSGSFPFFHNDKTHWTSAVIFGHSQEEILSKINYASLIYRHDFITNSFPVEISSPAQSEIFSGSIPIQWTVGEIQNQLLANLCYKQYHDKSWTSIVENSENPNLFNWDITEIPDGIFYQIQVTVHSDQGIGSKVADHFFTINNLGNAIPQAALFIDDFPKELTGNIPITWMAGDADQEPVDVKLEYSIDGGITYYPLGIQLPSQGELNWDTRHYPNTSQLLLLLTASNSSGTGTDSTENCLSITNSYNGISSDLIEHTQGNSTADVKAFITNSAAIQTAEYILTFHQLSDSTKTYTIKNLTSPTNLIENELLNNYWWSPEFDGLRLSFQDYKQAEIDFMSSGFQIGDSSYNWEGRLYNNEGIAVPFDYTIEIFDSIVTKSYNNKFVNFLVKNISLDTLSDFVFFPHDDDGLISNRDRIIPLVYDSTGTARGTWEIEFTIDDTSEVNFRPGTIFKLKTLKPLTDVDIYRITTDSTMLGIDEKLNHTLNSFQLFPNYPNPFNSTTTFKYFLPKCSDITISIYNIKGELIKSCSIKNQNQGTHHLVWDGKNSNGISIGSGVYIYQLTTPIGNNKTGKTVLLK